MSRKKKVTLIAVLIAVLGIVFLSIWDIFIDPPAWWRFDRQRDKRAILEYVEKNYPANIKRKGGSFPLQAPAGPFKASVMSFELDGIKFSVAAENGKVVNDIYPRARAEAQFDKIIQDGFMKTRGIEKAYTRYSFLDSYKETYPYTGGLVVRLSVFDQGSTPQDVGWLYDFYKYWKNEGSFLSGYSLEIYINENDDTLYHIICNSEKEFSDQDEFYAAFVPGHGP